MKKNLLFKNSMREIKKYWFQFFTSIFLIICGVSIFSSVELGNNEILRSYEETAYKYSTEQFLISNDRTNWSGENDLSETHTGVSINNNYSIYHNFITHNLGINPNTPTNDDAFILAFDKCLQINNKPSSINKDIPGWLSSTAYSQLLHKITEKEFPEIGIDFATKFNTSINKGDITLNGESVNIPDDTSATITNYSDKSNKIIYKPGSPKLDLNKPVNFDKIIVSRNAEKLGIKIGSKILIAGKYFTVSAYGESSYFAVPQYGTNIFPNEKNSFSISMSSHYAGGNAYNYKYSLENNSLISWEQSIDVNSINDPSLINEPPQNPDNFFNIQGIPFLNSYWDNVGFFKQKINVPKGKKIATNIMNNMFNKFYTIHESAESPNVKGLINTQYSSGVDDKIFIIMTHSTGQNYFSKNIRDFFYKLSYFDYGSFLGRISLISVLIYVKNNKFLIISILSILLVTCAIIIFIVLKKNISDSEKRIGLLKAIGYKDHNIAISYTAFSIFASFIGCGIGYIIGTFLQYPIVEKAKFQYPFIHYSFHPVVFLFSFLIPIVFLSLFSFIYSLLVVRKKVLSLLKKESSNKNSYLSIFLSKATKPLSFNIKFPILLAGKSVGKIGTIFISVLMTSFLILFSLSAGNASSRLFNKYSSTVNYKHFYNFYDYEYSFDNRCLTNPNASYCFVSGDSSKSTSQFDPNFSNYKGPTPFVNHDITDLNISSHPITLTTPNPTFNPTDSHSEWYKKLYEFYAGGFLENSLPVVPFQNVFLNSFYYDHQKDYPYISKNITLPLNDQVKTPVALGGDDGGIIFQALTPRSLEFDKTNNAETFKKLYEYTDSHKNDLLIPPGETLFPPIPVYISTYLKVLYNYKIGDIFSSNSGIKFKILGFDTDTFNNKVITTYQWMGALINQLQHKMTTNIWTNSDIHMRKNIKQDLRQYTNIDAHRMINMPYSTPEEQNSVTHYENCLYSKNDQNYLSSTTGYLGKNPLNIFDLTDTSSGTPQVKSGTELLSDRDYDFAISMIFDVDLFFKQIKAKLDETGFLINLFVVVASVISLSIILAISNLIIMENAGTISVMKILGYKNRSIGSLFLFIYSPSVFIGLLLSIPIASYIFWLLSSKLTQAIGAAFLINVTLPTIFITFGIILLLILICSIIGNRLIKNIGYLKVINDE